MKTSFMNHPSEGAPKSKSVSEHTSEDWVGICLDKKRASRLKSEQSGEGVRRWKGGRLNYEVKPRRAITSIAYLM